MQSSSLRLDPGRTRRKAAPCICRWACWTLLGIAAVSTIGLILFLHRFFERLKSPHEGLYFTGRLEDASSPAAYLTPLIDHEQTFDIGVTVWVRATEEEEESHLKSREGKERVPKLFHEYEDEDLLETPLYADIPLRGLRMTDKGVHTSVSFRLPTSQFRAENLSSTDLRGSFTLIPSGSSPLDHLSDFTSHLERPASRSFIPPVKYWPSRPWPFPLGSPARERTLVDQAIDTLSTTVGLVTFQEVASHCSDGIYAQVTETEDDEKFTDEAFADMLTKDTTMETVSYRTVPPWKKHPHIITRTHLRIYDEVRPLESNAFNFRQRELMRTVCTSGHIMSIPSRSKCTRSYPTHGHWETQFEVDTSPEETEYRYSPFLRAAPNGHGPMDLMPVPVTRASCLDSRQGGTEGLATDAVIDEEYMNVTWHISFSSQTPAKVLFSDSIGIFSRQPHIPNATHRERLLAQHYVELQHGLGGHTHREGAHPRRQQALTFFESLFAIICCVALFWYFFTRRTTAGISIFATVLSAWIQLSRELEDGIFEDDGSSPLWMAIWILVAGAIHAIGPWRLARIEISWRNRTSWIPIVHLSSPTHRERTSERLDGRVPLITKLMIFGGLAALYHFIEPENIFLIASRLPDTAAELSYPLLRHWLAVAFMASDLAQKGFQALLNHRLGTFAGSYRPMAVLELGMFLMSWGQAAPAVVGVFEVMPGLSVANVVITLLAVVLAWQAITLPPVPQTEGDNEE